MDLRRGGVRTARVVEAFRVQLGDDPGEYLEVVPQAPGAVADELFPTPVLITPDVLVAPVPHGQAGVRHQSGYVVPGLRDNLTPQRFFLRVGGAGEQEVLPYQYAALIT